MGSFSENGSNVESNKDEKEDYKKVLLYTRSTQKINIMYKVRGVELLPLVQF